MCKRPCKSTVGPLNGLVLEEYSVHYFWPLTGMTHCPIGIAQVKYFKNQDLPITVEALENTCRVDAILSASRYR